MAFHEIQFPNRIAYGATGGPMRKTEIASQSSGYEQRNAPWTASRHKYNVASGAKNFNDLHTIKTFWEARLGQLYGFRFKDFADFKSCPPSTATTNLDQTIGVGNGTVTTFQMSKVYTSGSNSYTRVIQKPVSGTVLVAVNGVAKTEGTNYTVNYVTGVITFLAGSIPGAGQAITAGFEFDVPVRFDQDSIETNLSNFNSGQIDAITLIELRLNSSGQ